jgi:hypothetical protein
MNEIIDSKLELDKTRILRIQAEMQNSLEELVESDKANSSIFPELKEEVL